MKFFSLSTVFIVLCIAYLLHSCWSIYHMWYPESCLKKGRHKYCLKSLIHEREKFSWNIDVYGSSNEKFSSYSSSLITSWKNMNFNEAFVREYNIQLTSSTTNNGSYFIYMFLYPSGMSAFNGKYVAHSRASVTEYKYPVSYFKLMKENNSESEIDKNRPTTHWRPKINVHVMSENFKFDQHKIPPELFHLIKLSSFGEYMPIFFCDEIFNKKTDLVLLQKNAKSINITLRYSPISVGKLRFWVSLSQSFKMMKSFGFSDADLDDIKGIFSDTSMMFLGLTMIVSAFHILFDFLGFKSDVKYWKKRKTMLGLSYHSVIYRCISTIIIFFYLLDQKTSLLILVPAGIGSIIEIWKVTKALKIGITRTGWKLQISFGQSSEIEKETENFDQQAIRYLSFVMYPLCVGGAIYSLFYVPHKSWYSWIIQSLVNGVYAFGFLFMLPQLFINYKLKSVAHLPWKAFMYKAFNTFIDDVFAFIIHMPTSHRLACFRDDIVFFCYLYQLWLYPVDKKRVNEYGYCYDKEEDKKEK